MEGGSPKQQRGNPFTGARRGSQVSPFQGSTYHATFPRALPWAIAWRPFGAFRGWFIVTGYTSHHRNGTHGHRPDETHEPSSQRNARASSQRNTRASSQRNTRAIVPTEHTASPQPHARSPPQRYGRRYTNLTVPGPNGAKCDSPGQRPGSNGHKYPQP